MKNTKKYKFVGYSGDWQWNTNPTTGSVYNQDQLALMYGKNWECVGGIKLIEGWNDSGEYSEGWEIIDDSVVGKLERLDSIFDTLLSCTGDLWNEIRYGEVDIEVVDQKKILELITSITHKYDKLNKNFNNC